ncbi:hypothetical protein [Paenibacillus sp. MMS20-IR301]|uniref:hypothetical protein n=1 Tax=Paenibacillus sp. MMS20-IR301 TaxID=2895946 RepID=UPI0028EA511A|nr:hypothetical protein [Paenibacillus sp. MMS20-IR301]WNS43949.1 hypothetical protein LOS79_01405 [Paenibacillus sp. MMS20-IR301]
MNYDCLIVDDEVELAETTSEYFNLFNVQTAFVTNVQDCRDFMREHTVSMLLLCLVLISVSYVVSMLVANRIRRISMYALISE